MKWEELHSLTCFGSSGERKSKGIGLASCRQRFAFRSCLDWRRIVFVTVVIVLSFRESLPLACLSSFLHALLLLLLFNLIFFFSFAVRVLQWLLLLYRQFGHCEGRLHWSRFKQRLPLLCNEYRVQMNFQDKRQTSFPCCGLQRLEWETVCSLGCICQFLNEFRPIGSAQIRFDKGDEFSPQSSDVRLLDHISPADPLNGFTRLCIDSLFQTRDQERSALQSGTFSIFLDFLQCTR